MNTSLLSLPSPRRLFTGFFTRALVLALVLAVGVMPATAHAQRFGGRAFGPSFGRGLGWGLGIGIGSALVYDSLNYNYPPQVIYTAAPQTVYYVPQPASPPVVVNYAPAPVASPAVTIAAPAAPVPVATSTTSSTGKLSRILYDANGKPAGVLVLNANGQQEYVPLAQ